MGEEGTYIGNVNDYTRNYTKIDNIQSVRGWTDGALTLNLCKLKSLWNLTFHLAKDGPKPLKILSFRSFQMFHDAHKITSIKQGPLKLLSSREILVKIGATKSHWMSRNSQHCFAKAQSKKRWSLVSSCCLLHKTQFCPLPLSSVYEPWCSWC
jgi:hypothetical protein